MIIIILIIRLFSTANIYAKANINNPNIGNIYLGINTALFNETNNVTSITNPHVVSAIVTGLIFFLSSKYNLCTLKIIYITINKPNTAG